MTPLIIDVREPYEFEDGHVEGAINIPPQELLAGAPDLDQIDRSTPIIVYCRTGARSNTSKHILTNMGFANITNGVNKEHVERMIRR